VCVDSIKRVISDCDEVFEVKTQVDQGLTSDNRFDSVISTNDAN
jgi:hypothetical protein